MPAAGRPDRSGPLESNRDPMELQMSMNVDDVFPDKYYKADNIPVPPQVLTIEKVRNDYMRDGTIKRVVQFYGRVQALPLNKTNAKTLASIAGTKDMAAWSGTQVELYVAPCQFEGESTQGVRVREPQVEAPDFGGPQEEADFGHDGVQAQTPPGALSRSASDRYVTASGRVDQQTMERDKVAAEATKAAPAQPATKSRPGARPNLDLDDIIPF
jgi:hypothetical protein